MDEEENNNIIEKILVEEVHTESSNTSSLDSHTEGNLSNENTDVTEDISEDDDDDSRIELELDKSGMDTDLYLKQKTFGDTANKQKNNDLPNITSDNPARTGDRKNTIIIQEHLPFTPTQPVNGNEGGSDKVLKEEHFLDCDQLCSYSDLIRKDPKMEASSFFSNESQASTSSNGDEIMQTIDPTDRKMKVPSLFSNESQASTSGMSNGNKFKNHANRCYRSTTGSFSSSSDSDLSSEEDIDTTVAKRQKLKENEKTSANANNTDVQEVELGNIDTPPAAPRSPVYSLRSSISNESSISSVSDIYRDDEDEEDDEEDGDDEDTIDVDDLKFLFNEKPKHKWIAVRELMYREIGLSGIGRRSLSGKSSTMFQKRISGSLNSVQRLELMGKLKKHSGCVNSLNFNKAGNILATGSDDLNIILWNWAFNTPILSFHSGHSSNVFQTKFIDLGNSDINLVSSARDGQVRHSFIPPGCGKTPNIKMLYRQCGSVHKIAIPPTNHFEVLSASEDGSVYRYDFRENEINKLLTVKARKRNVQLYSISAHPLDNEFCVCGRDQYIRVYDRRNLKICSKQMTPEHLSPKKSYETNTTCAVYNSTGSEILASYTDDDIYLFDNVNYEDGKYLHRYRGHSNASTIKGVSFFGPNSEFIMSGSDCGYFFMWDKESETIVQWQHADEAGVVNCLEPHPEFPMMASSGLDHDIKIWVPSNESEPTFEGLEKKVRRNLRARHNNCGGDDIFDEQLLNFLMRMRNIRNAREESETISTDDETFDSDDDLFGSNSDNHLAGARLRSFPCSPS